MYRYNRKITLLIFICILHVFFLGNADAGTDNAATVNGVGISSARLESEFNGALKYMKSQGKIPGPDEINGIKMKVLNNMISEELIFQDCQKNNITMSEAEVDQELNRLKSRYQTDEAFKNALSKMGMTEKQLKKQIKRRSVIQKFVKVRFIDPIEVTEIEIEKHYKKNIGLFESPEMIRASHILIKCPEEAGKKEKNAALKKIKDVEKKLKGGEDFTLLAKKVSEGPSKSIGGDLNYFERGKMVKPFEKAAFALSVGEISGIVKTRFGYHIIKVFDKKKPETAPLEDVKNHIENKIKREKFDMEINTYISKLKNDADIKTYIEE